MRLRKDAKIELISRVPLFEGLSGSHLGKVARLADEIDVREGKELTREGERGEEFFVLVEGEAVVRRKGRKVGTLGSGDFFGEIALVADTPRTATVATTAESRVLVITRRGFQELLRDTPAVQVRVLEALAKRVAPQTI